MAIRIIRKDNEDILRKRSREVTVFDNRLIELLDDMCETMHSANGIGLAAVQVGILKRVIIVDIGDELIELINPVMVKSSGEQIDSEGCLSIPGKYGEVLRPNEVVFEGLNRHGEKISVEAEGLKARALCHELDHLEGVLFTDKVIRFVDTSRE